MQHAKVIGLVAGSSAPPAPALFQRMAGLFPVRFQNVRPGSWDGLDAVVFVGLESSCPGLPSLQIPAAATAKNPASLATVQFAQTGGVPRVFRGRAVAQEDLAADASLNLKSGDQILATLNKQPIWTARDEGGRRIDLSAMALPDLEAETPFFNCFAPRNFVRLLPLVDFLLRLTGEDQWTLPAPRAQFMFDDPNLHSAGYGWIHFRELAQHAALHNYHASMATIPLDAWFAGRQAAGLFADHPDRLSFLIHGNDHLYEELAAFSSDEQRLGALAQALKRISRLEARTSLEVSRVMAAPHGACSEETLRDMARLGFEAACISSGSLHNYNSGKSWAKNIGLNMSEFVAGLPVIPRFRLKRDCKNDILLAAYLGQPIVPVGHHQEVADGLDLLADLAAFINSLGEVRWMDMKGIARSNFKTRMDGSLLHVQSFSRVFKLPVPPGVAQVSVQRPEMAEAVDEGICVRAPGKPDRVLPHYAGEPFPVQPGAALEIASFLQNQVDPGSVRLPKLRMWPVARRILTEGRDRLAPFAGRLRSR